jgi:hypothetical protein
MRQKTRALNSAVNMEYLLKNFNLPIDVGKICEELDKIRATIEPIVGIICEQYEKYKAKNTLEQYSIVSKLFNLFINVPSHTK